MKTLADLRPGEIGTLVELRVSRPVAERLGELGLLPGARVEMRFEGPVHRDPIAIFVRGSVLALRRSEASEILVDDVRPAAREAT